MGLRWSGYPLTVKEEGKKEPAWTVWPEVTGAPRVEGEPSLALSRGAKWLGLPERIRSGMFRVGPLGDADPTTKYYEFD